jgi:hypothetical protein
MRKVSSFAIPRRTWIVLALVSAWLLVALRGDGGHFDVLLYHFYAVNFWAGSPPLRTLPAEYPVLALLPFTLTLVPPLPDFVTVFGVWMLGLLVLVVVLIARRDSPRAAEVCAVYLAIGAWGTLLARYDLVPAAVTLAAWWAARERRFAFAYLLLAAGTLLKLYPLLLVPAIALEQYRALGRHPFRSPPPRAVLAGGALFCGIAGLGFLVAGLLNPAGWLGPLSYGAHRPLQVESLSATLLWAGSLAGSPVVRDHSFGSDNLVGQLDRAIGLAADAGLVLGLLWTWWRQASGRLDLGRALVASLLIVLCTGRVLSPQYLIWLLPLLAIVEPGYDVLWLVVCLLTTLIYPFAYAQLHPLVSGGPRVFPVFFLALIAFRNVALGVATARFLLGAGARELRPGPAF